MEPFAPVQKQPSLMLEVEARLKILPIHGGVENFGIHYGDMTNRVLYAPTQKGYKRLHSSVF